MDLHPGEQVVFEGHPSWRGLLAFYLGGVAGAVVIAVVVGLLTSFFGGLVTGVVLVAAVLGFGLFKRMSTTYLVSSQRLLYPARDAVQARAADTDRPCAERQHRAVAARTDAAGRDRDFDTAGTDDSEFRFVGIASPDEVVSAVDRAQRDAAASR